MSFYFIIFLINNFIFTPLLLLLTVFYFLLHSTKFSFLLLLFSFLFSLFSLFQQLCPVRV